MGWLEKRGGAGLVILLLVLNLLLGGCGDVIPTSTSTPVPVATPTIAPATPTPISATIGPTATAVATTIEATATAIPTATALATPTTVVAPTAIATATLEAETTNGPDEVEAVTPPPTIALPKLDAKTEGVLLYEYQGDLWALLLPDGVRSNLTKSGFNNKVLVNRHPVWSPDSLQIAFASLRDSYNQPGYQGGYDVYMMRLDGSNLTRLTKDGDSLAIERLPIAWLPTGDILVKQFSHGGSPTAGQEPPFVLLNPETAAVKALPITDPNYDYGAVAVSPDKSQIAYVVRKPGNNPQETKADVYLASLSKGGTPVALTNFPAAQYFDIAALAWSPDGQNIVLAQTCSAGCCGLTFYSVGKGGGTPRELFKGKGLLAGMSYAPSGKWLAYSSGGECAGTDGSFKLRLLDTEKGGTPLELVEGFSPSYGKKIVG